MAQTLQQGFTEILTNCKNTFGDQKILVVHTPRMSSILDEQRKILMREYKSFLTQNQFIAHIPNRNKYTLWHLTIPGPKDTPFEGGYYHFEFDLSKYPKDAPIVMALNNNGSFQVNKPLCLTGVTHWHQEAWVDTKITQLLVALQCAMVSEDPRDRAGIGILGDITSSSAVQTIKKLAQDSKNYTCPTCKKCIGDYKMVQ